MERTSTKSRDLLAPYGLGDLGDIKLLQRQQAGKSRSLTRKTHITGPSPPSPWFSRTMFLDVRTNSVKNRPPGRKIRPDAYSSALSRVPHDCVVPTRRSFFLTLSTISVAAPASNKDLASCPSSPAFRAHSRRGPCSQSRAPVSWISCCGRGRGVGDGDGSRGGG